jgi:hypothetical protein
VKLLLADDRVDPATDNNYAIGLASYSGHLAVVKLLLADERVDPSALVTFAITMTGFGRSMQFPSFLLEHPAVVVTESALSVAAAHGDEHVILLLSSKQPQLMLPLFRGEVRCVASHPLRTEVKEWEERSASTLLLALKRTQSSQVAPRVSDVWRDVFERYACFHVVGVDL